MLIPKFSVPKQINVLHFMILKSCEEDSCNGTYSFAHFELVCNLKIGLKLPGTIIEF